MGMFDFLLGPTSSGASRQATSTNSSMTQSAAPWAGIAPFLTGGVGPNGESVAGIYPEAGRLYGGSGWTPAMQDTSANWFNDVINRRNIFNGNGFANAGAAMVAGQFDPRIAAAGPIAGPAPIAPQSPTPVSARAAQGELDPTAALKGFLEGNDANPWAAAQGEAITDLLTRNLLETVAPQIRHQAIADGQYGGSRGDLALGTALSRLDTDIAPALAQLAGTAWENEQARKYDVATGLNQQAGQFAQADADRKLRADTTNAGNLLDVQKFNTGTTLANNAQAMQAAAQAVANRGAGLGFASGAADLQDQTYADLLNALDLPQDFDWDQLARYASIIQPAAGLFPTITRNTTGSSTASGSRSSAQNDISGLLGPMVNGLVGLFGL